MSVNLNGTFTATGHSEERALGPGQYNLSLSGFPPGDTASVTVERSFDGGQTWGGIGSFSADAQQILTVGGRSEAVRHRLRCTAFDGGGIDYRLG